MSISEYPCPAPVKVAMTLVAQEKQKTSARYGRQDWRKSIEDVADLATGGWCNLRELRKVCAELRVLA
jgi:hypothetical protein